MRMFRILASVEPKAGSALSFAMHFDLTDLHLFLAVVDAGSITHGAAEAGLSLPAASERLRNMELSGGVVLLTRGRRGVSPTQAGETLAHHARLIRGQMARMRGELGEHAGDLRTTIRLIANTASLTEFLPERLAPWMAAHPKIDVELKERLSVEIAKAIGAGLADIGVLSDAVDTAGLQLRPFAVDRLAVVVAASDALAGRKTVSFDAMAHRDFVGLTSGAFQAHIDGHAERMGLGLKVRVRMRSFDGVCRMAASGVGFGIVPEVAARRCRRSMRIAAVRLTDGWATRRLAVCFRAEEELGAAARELVGYLASPEGSR
jgi:DNA-binding transcriptional LysR family regulator